MNRRRFLSLLAAVPALPLLAKLKSDPAKAPDARYQLPPHEDISDQITIFDPVTYQGDFRWISKWP